MGGLLDGLSGPADLRRLPAAALPELAAEIREFLVDSVTRTGGHLGPNLGVVELTIALHRVFESPRDPIIWDTGHQAYVHKLLTGRRAGFARLRQSGGLSGYPSRAESEHDLVENSHASTALSYADGMAKAFALQGCRDRHVVAVVGDGALTGGLSWEALNNLAGAPHRPVVIVLNDNGRSYAPTAGAVAAHLERLRRGDRSPAWFEALGLAYVGPVDGHDVDAVEAALRTARRLGRPVVVHCVTRKGAGYAPAENDEAERLHAVGPAKPAGANGSAATSWTQVFSDEIVRIGTAMPDVVAVTAAMLGPTGLVAFADQFPERVYDVGIAEQQAVASAAGLAAAGMHPVVCVYSTFLNRAFDQTLMDVGLHRAPVTFVLDRAGVTGDDGASHNGMWDLSLLGIVPEMRVAAPRDADRLCHLLAEAVRHDDGPTALRFPKGAVARRLDPFDRMGEADVLARGGDDVLVVTVGPVAGAAVDAAAELERSGIGVTVVDPRWVLPVDPSLVLAAAGYRLAVTVEENGVSGGFGDAFARAVREAGLATPVRSLGLPQRFLRHASRAELLAEHGLDCAGIVAAVRADPHVATAHDTRFTWYRDTSTSVAAR